MKHKLRDRHRAVIDRYFCNGFIKSEAMRFAGYSVATAQSKMNLVFERPEVLTEISKRKKKIAASAISRKTCIHCGASINDGHKNLQKCLKCRRASARKRPEQMLVSARARAKKLGLEFNLTLEDIHIPERCPYLGVLLRPSLTGSAQNNSPSLDRIDNTRGYIKGNVEVISSRANKCKSDLTLEEMERMAKAFLERANSR